MSEKNTLKALYEDSLKTELMEEAKDMGLTGISKLKKAELIDMMEAWMLDPANIQRRLSILTNPQMLLLNKALDGDVKLEPVEMERACAICETDYAYLVHDPVEIKMTSSGIERRSVYRLCIPDDLKVAIRGINTPEFYEKRELASWTRQCIDFCEITYGITPLKVLAEVCALDPALGMTREDLDKVVEDFPWELTGSFKKDDLVVAEDLAAEEDFDALMKEQGSCLFDLPDYFELLDILMHMYPAGRIPYENLTDFCVREMGMSKKDAEDYACDVWNGFVMNKDGRTTLMKAMQEAELDKAGRLRELLEECDRVTRKRALRGFTLAGAEEEAARKEEEKQEKEAAVREAQREQAERRLQALKNKDAGKKAPGPAPVGNMPQYVLPKRNPGIKKMDKVYPNDPCPCGSGKKYKKCCGRK